MKAEAALVHSVPVSPGFGQSSYDDSPTFSMDDFEGNVVVCSDVGQNIRKSRIVRELGDV